MPAEQTGQETYRISRDRQSSRHNKDDRDEKRPDASPDVNERAELPQVPRTTFELAERKFADDRDAVAPVQRDGADVEDTRDGRVGAETDEIDGDAPEDGDPDREDRGTGQGQDLSPEG